MKKFLSVIMAAAMLLSIIIVAAVPASAADGQWVVYTDPTEYGLDSNGEEQHPFIWGYEYTDEGFTTVSPDWVGVGENRPYGTVQTREPVDFSEGIYLKVRVDRYTYANNDCWINISLWDSQNIKPGDSNYGQGVQNLLRPQKDAETGKWYYSPIEWYVGTFSNAGKTTGVDAEGNTIKTYVEDDGSVIFEYELKLVNGVFELSINGNKAPITVVQNVYDLFPDNEAYVGITLMNKAYGTDVGLTILEFGTTKETAEVPSGDDYVDPINGETEEVAEIADPSTVAPGQPAILMTGDKTNSDTKDFIAGQGDTGSINDDFSIRVTDTSGNRWISTGFSVKSEVSYDIDDFPVVGILTKNYCNCDDPSFCMALESFNLYVMAGDMRAPASNGCSKTRPIDVCWEPIVVGEDSYLYFYFDTSSETAVSWLGKTVDWAGRIHGIQVETDEKSLMSDDAGRNSVNFAWVGFFRTVEELEAYVYESLGLESPSEDTEAPVVDTTEAPVVDTTEAPVVDTTEAPVVDTTEAKQDDVTTEAKGEDKTEAKGEEKTEAKGEEKTEAKGETPASSGCGSMIGAGAVAVIALVATSGAVVLKKKED